MNVSMTVLTIKTGACRMIRELTPLIDEAGAGELSPGAALLGVDMGETFAALPSRWLDRPDLTACPERRPDCQEYRGVLFAASAGDERPAR
jgi:hypothetical protein